MSKESNKSDKKMDEFELLEYMGEIRSYLEEHGLWGEIDVQAHKQIKSLITKYADLPNSLNKDYLLGYEQGKFDVIAEQERERAESRPDTPADEEVEPFYFYLIDNQISIVKEALDGSELEHYTTDILKETLRGWQKIKHILQDYSRLKRKNELLIQTIESRQPTADEEVAKAMERAHAEGIRQVFGQPPADEEVELMEKIQLVAKEIYDSIQWGSMCEMEIADRIKHLLQSRQPKRVSREELRDKFRDFSDEKYGSVIADINNSYWAGAWESFDWLLNELGIEVSDK